MENNEKLDFTSSAWRENVYIETAEHIIRGYIFMPKIGKRQRLITEVLNAGKDCTIEYKLLPSKAVESHDFIQVNVSSILIMRPTDE